MPGQHWSRNFTVDPDDIEYLTGLLLEQEKPLTTEQLAHALIQQRLDHETTVLQERFKDARLYNPAESYASGERVIFPAYDYAIGQVMDTRPGQNPQYREFTVIAIDFEETNLNLEDRHREFAADLTTPHVLMEVSNLSEGPVSEMMTVEDVLDESREYILDMVDTALSETDDLVQVANQWFPIDLLLETNVGHLNLAEAVLDINEGGPLTTTAILKEIGGLGSGKRDLEVFSLNYVLRDDSRFDEVGPAGEVQWFLRRLEPEDVQNTPLMLQYTPIPYDRELLDDEMLVLESEIDDELSVEAPAITSEVEEATITLLYPHRRMGTLPLNSKTSHIFPSGHKTARVAVQLIDGQDGDVYPAWVVQDGRYVYGLDTFYRKHRLPVGAFVSVRVGDEPGQMIVDFNAHRPRTEWIRLIVPHDNQINFENHKRNIGAEYDDLMILGADELEAVDALFAHTHKQKRPLAAILKTIVPALGNLTPQGTAHALTIYSAVNVMRRCPPGPILATLAAHPDFENVGGNYWKLADS